MKPDLQHSSQTLESDTKGLESNSKELEPRRLTDEQFQGLAQVPPEVEWFANIRNVNTKKAYKRDVRDFSAFVGIGRPEDFRVVTWAHLIAWRDDLERRALAAATIRRMMSALSSLFDYLCNANAVTHNAVTGVERPTEGANEGKTPAISDAQARALLEAPSTTTLKGKRDRAILAVFLFNAIRADELVKLKVQDISQRQGVTCLKISGKRGKVRYIPTAPSALTEIDTYLEAAGHSDDKKGALFRPTKNNVTKTLNKPLHYQAVYQLVKHYGEAIGLLEQVTGFSVHALRATAITNTLENGADLAESQVWAGHADISTTRLYDRRRNRLANSPSFKVRY